MKRIYLAAALLLILITNSQASHIIGGDINYRYIGDSSGVANQYEVVLRIYRDCSPATATFISGTIKVKSSCYPNMNITLAPVLIPGSSNNEFPPQQYTDCVDPQTVRCVGVRIFKGVVTLPGQCADFRFIYEDCCRPSGINNLVSSTSQSFYFSASLNNMQAPNSLAKPNIEFLKAFCVTQNANWSPSVTDPDGDSLYFTIEAVKGSNNVPLAYAAGYSAQQPLPTNPPQSFSINAATGQMQFVPAATGTFVVGFVVAEYRFDSTLFAWALIANNTSELLVAIASNCTPIAQIVQYDYNAPGLYAHPVNGLPTFDKQCADTTITVKFATAIECTSIAQNGSDFRLAAPNGQPIPIKSAVGNCAGSSETQQIELTLFSPYATNGLHILYSKNGNDGNTLVNTCGYSMYEYDTLQINVTGCSGIGLTEEKIEPAPIIPTALRLGNAFSITIPENLAGDYQLSFYNLQGALLFTEAFHGSGNWVVQNAGAFAKPGMYVCRLESAIEPDRQWQQKVVALP